MSTIQTKTVERPATSHDTQRVFSPARVGIAGPTPDETAALKAHLARSEKWKDDWFPYGSRNVSPMRSGSSGQFGGSIGVRSGHRSTTNANGTPDFQGCHCCSG